MTRKAVRRKSKGYYQVTDGEWITVSKRGFREQCCDCGLIHKLNFRVTDSGRIQIQTFRDPRATNGARTHFRFTKEGDE